MTISGISEFYDTTVSVSRNVSGGQSPSGATKSVLTPIIPSLVCTTQSDEDRLVMPASGQTAIDFRMLYCDLYNTDGTANDIRQKDVITIVSAPAGVNVGAKYLVVQVDDYSQFRVDHLEVTLQGGVL